MSKEQWLANYERSEECSRMIDSPPVVVNNVAEKTITCDQCGRTYFIGAWPFCPHDKPCYSWYMRDKDAKR